MKIGFLSDAHGNYQGFLKGLNVLSDKNVDEIYFLGDAVGYLNSIKVLKYLETQRGQIKSILGNHDLMLLGEELQQDKDQVYQLNKIRKRVSSELKCFLNALPQEIVLEQPCGNIQIIHGAPDNISYGYVYPDTDLKNYKNSPYDYVFMGNTHRPFVRKEFGIYFVNVGSCGLSRDVGAMGSVCVLDTEKCEPTIYRYDMSEINKKVIRQYKLHESVALLFSRSSETIFGTKV